MLAVWRAAWAAGRTDARGADTAAAGPAAPAADPDRRGSRPVVQRHCCVQGLPDAPGRWPGLLAEWRQPSTVGADASAWEGRVVYAVAACMGGCVLVEAWLPAAHLSPA